MPRVRCSPVLGRSLACALCAWLLAAAGCGYAPVSDDRAPAKSPDLSGIPDAVPKVEPKSRYGNPQHYEVFGKRYTVLDSSEGYAERGVASWYGTKFHGRRTSSGEPYDMYAMTAAHKSLPLPTYVRVTNLNNDRSAVLRVNDRGPFHDDRIIDLSYTAAKKLGIVKNGTGLVEVVAIDPRSYGKAPPAVDQMNGSTDPVQRETYQLFVQVGAFSSRANAERLRGELAPAFEERVFVSPTVNGQAPVYRVRFGPLSDVEHADSLTSKLPRRGVEDFHIVVE